MSITVAFLMGLVALIAWAVPNLVHAMGNDEQISRVASQASYAASGGTFVLGFTFEHWMMLAGFILGLATFLLNWYYKHKHYKLAERSSDHTPAD